MVDINKNITSIFMIPTLGIPYGKLNENGFINGYIDDQTHDSKYKNCVFVLFKPKDMDVFRIFLDAENERIQDIVEDYDYEGGFVVIVYKLPKKFKDDFKLIKKGKYSKTSDEFKQSFPKVMKVKIKFLHRDELTLQWRIFRKDQNLKEHWEKKIGVKFSKNQEVWSGWHKESEILNIENIKEMYVQPANI